MLQASRGARLRIVGQAPSRRVHESGIPWHDASGDRLRSWLGLPPGVFYDAERVAIVPMGFCYPGKATSGDRPPRPECAERWHDPLSRCMPDIRLTLLVGHHAQAHYLGPRRHGTLTATVRDWRSYLRSGFVPLPHPSPRNQPWLAANPWFLKDVLPGLRKAIAQLRI